FAHIPERIGWPEYLARLGESSIDTRAGVRFSHAYLAIEAALAGDGVALVRRTLVAEDLRRGRLVAPLAFQVPSALTYYWISASDPARKPMLSGLQRYLRDSLREAQAVADRALAAPNKRQKRSADRRSRHAARNR